MAQLYAVRPGDSLSKTEKKAVEFESIFCRIEQDQNLAPVGLGVTFLVPYLATFAGLVVGLLVGGVGGGAFDLATGSDVASMAGAIGALIVGAGALVGSLAWVGNRYRSNRKLRKLIKEGRVLILAGDGTCAAIVRRAAVERAFEATRALPDSLRADVAEEAGDLIWRIAKADAELGALEAMDRRVMTAQQAGDRYAAKTALETVQAGLVDQLSGLTDKAVEAGQLKGSDQAGTVAAALVLAGELAKPNTEAIGGELLEAYTQVYAASRPEALTK